MRIVEIRDFDSRRKRVIVEGETFADLEFQKVAQLVQEQLGDDIRFEPPYPDVCYLVDENGQKIPFVEPNSNSVRKYRFEFNVWVK